MARGVSLTRGQGLARPRRRPAHANAPDGTLRNVRAARKRTESLRARVLRLELAVLALAKRLGDGGL